MSSNGQAAVAPGQDDDTPQPNPDNCTIAFRPCKQSSTRISRRLGKGGIGQRNPQRPLTLEYIERIFTDWSEIHGDRGFADDPAMVCGMARFHGEEVVVIGHQKARDTKQNVYRNWGMTNPEGYRKALRVMKIAEKFKRPIFTFVDTVGAYPGLSAEERGQAEAIARNLREMARMPSSNYYNHHGRRR